jgi:hypothetical protein
MRLEIANRRDLHRWLGERRELDHDFTAIKGPPPKGATYEDGELITGLVNIGWKDIVTGEVFSIEYAGELP